MQIDAVAVNFGQAISIKTVFNKPSNQFSVLSSQLVRAED
jgi:hypothetical protein